MLDADIEQAVIAALQNELKSLLRHNPHADRRKMLDRAVEHQMEKLELRFIAKSDNPVQMRGIIKALLDDAANDIRATL